jgi:hypothetical protein
VIISRAGFLKLGAAALASRALPSWPLSAAGEVSGRIPAGQTPALFRPHLGTAFRLRELSQPLVLAKIVEQPRQPNVEQFSLLFQGPAKHPLSDGTYTLRHAALGRIDLFISPVGRPADEAVYEACFSRHVGPVRGRG